MGASASAIRSTGSREARIFSMADGASATGQFFCATSWTCSIVRVWPSSSTSVALGAGSREPGAGSNPFPTLRSPGISILFFRGGYQLLEIHQIGGVVAGVAGIAIFVAVIANGLAEGREGEVAKRIGFDVTADFFHAVRAGDQLAAVGSVNTVKAGRDGGGAGDAKMDFGCAGLAHHAHDLAADGSTDNRIIDEHDAFALQQMADGIVFELHAEITDGLGRLDEGTADVVIADDGLAEGEPGFGGVTDGGGDTGIGNGDNDIGISGTLAREHAA